MNEIKSTDETKKEIALYCSKACGLSFPARKPKSFFYERTDGQNILLYESGSWVNPKTKEREHIGLSYGMPARLLMQYCCEQVRLNQIKGLPANHINLQTSLAGFMQSVGMSKGGRNNKTFPMQVRKFFSARIAIENEKRKLTIQDTISRGFQVLWDTKNSHNQNIMPNYAVLGDLYMALIKVCRPIDKAIVRAIGRDCIGYDLYQFYNAKTFNTIYAQINWDEVANRLGNDFSSLKHLKEKVNKAHKKLEILMPPNNIRISSAEGIIIVNSTSAIPPKTHSIKKVEHWQATLPNFIKKPLKHLV